MSHNDSPVSVTIETAPVSPRHMWHAMALLNYGLWLLRQADDWSEAKLIHEPQNKRLFILEWCPGKFSTCKLQLGALVPTPVLLEPVQVGWNIFILPTQSDVSVETDEFVRLHRFALELSHMLADLLAPSKEFGLFEYKQRTYWTPIQQLDRGTLVCPLIEPAILTVIDTFPITYEVVSTLTDPDPNLRLYVTNQKAVVQPAFLYH